jgi:hypothetical protein
MSIIDGIKKDLVVEDQGKGSELELDKEIFDSDRDGNFNERLLAQENEREENEAKGSSLGRRLFT